MSPEYALSSNFMQSVDQQTEWYVLRVTYQREMIAKRRLDEIGVESFVPTRLQRKRLANGRISMQRTVLVHNYIFIHSDRSTIDEIKLCELPYLRYVMHTKDNLYQPMRVPEEQMRSFILVTGSEDERLMVLDVQSSDLKVGTKVCIIGGVFVGAQGILTKLSGVRDRRVVVKIEGIAAVATPKIEKELLEIIE